MDAWPVVRDGNVRLVVGSNRHLNHNIKRSSFYKPFLFDIYNKRLDCVLHEVGQSLDWALYLASQRVNKGRLYPIIVPRSE